MTKGNMNLPHHAAWGRFLARWQHRRWLQGLSHKVRSKLARASALAQGAFQLFNEQPWCKTAEVLEARHEGAFKMDCWVPGEFPKAPNIYNIVRQRRCAMGTSSRPMCRTQAQAASLSPSFRHPGTFPSGGENGTAAIKNLGLEVAGERRPERRRGVIELKTEKVLARPKSSSRKKIESAERASKDSSFAVVGDDAGLPAVPACRHAIHSGVELLFNRSARALWIGRALGRRRGGANHSPCGRSANTTTHKSLRSCKLTTYLKPCAWSNRLTRLHSLNMDLPVDAAGKDRSALRTLARHDWEVRRFFPNARAEYQTRRSHRRFPRRCLENGVEVLQPARNDCCNALRTASSKILDTEGAEKC